MNEKQFLSCVEELVDADKGTLNIDDTIVSIEKLDSVAFLGIISFADSMGIFLSIDDFIHVEKLVDIYRIIQARNPCRT